MSTYNTVYSSNISYSFDDSIKVYNNKGNLYYSQDSTPEPTAHKAKGKPAAKKKEMKQKNERKDNHHDLIFKLLLEDPAYQNHGELHVGMITNIESHLGKYLTSKIVLNKRIYINRYYPLIEENGHSQFITGNGSAQALVNNVFDVVIISDILEYMTSMMTAANIIKRCLGTIKSHGYLLIIAKSKEKVKNISIENGHLLTTSGYKIVKNEEVCKFIKGYDYSELEILTRFARANKIRNPSFMKHLINPIEKASNCICLVAR